MTRELALCADDFGLSAGVDAGILALVEQERLSAVSCLVNGPAWAQDGHRIAALRAVRKGRVQLGLHFNLTEGRPLSAALARLWPRLPDLKELLVAAHLRRLPQAALRDELQAQWRAFEAGTGRPPDHLDGHQHVHHLPQLRELVLEAVSAAPGLTVRDTGRVLGPGHALKRLIIEGSGGRALRRQLQPLGRQANSSLLGVYDFQQPDYRALMQSWLAALPARGGLIFCHPGAEPAAALDPIAAARLRECSYLGSADFATDLERADARLVRSA